MNAPNQEPAALPMGLRERVMAASLLARGAGQPVPAVPEISGSEAFGRAAGAFDRLLCALDEEDWTKPARRGLDVQGLVGHLIGVEDDVQRGMAGDPAVAGASHVESTQGAAVRQADRSPALTRDEWCSAAERTLDLPASPKPGWRYTASGFLWTICWWSGPSSCGCTTTTSAAPSACRLGPRHAGAADDERSRRPAAAVRRGQGGAAGAGGRAPGAYRARRRNLGDHARPQSAPATSSS